MNQEHYIKERKKNRKIFKKLFLRKNIDLKLFFVVSYVYIFIMYILKEISG